MRAIGVAGGIALALIVLAFVTYSEPPQISEPKGEVAPAVWAETVPNDDGRHIRVSWTKDRDAKAVYLVFGTTKLDAAPPSPVGGKLIPIPKLLTVPRDHWTKALSQEQAKPTPEQISRGDWVLMAKVEAAGHVKLIVAPGTRARYAVMTARETGKDTYGLLSPAVVSEPVKPVASLFNSTRWFYLLIVLMMGAALFYYTRKVRRDPKSVYVRRIPGVDAIEDSVGRSTEMGRPVLYVTGVEEIQNIQTIASLLVLGHVAEIVADYDTEMKVANFFPLTMVVAEEIVRQGFANAGRIDAHKPENVMFISAEQFAFAAGVNGLILRDKPATNIYLGRFFAESLILAETGYVTRAVQIAGTAEITQLPFFIAACDYTIIGEELYAVSAYLSREPGLLAMLKSNDFLKVVMIVLVVIGAVVSTFSIGGVDVGSFLMP
jgi:hypothetical protein